MIRLQIDSPSQDGALDLVRSAISREISRLELGLATTKKKIAAFEERYQVSSEVFLHTFTSEDLTGGDQEYIEWSGEIMLQERISQQLTTLRDIEYAG